MNRDDLKRLARIRLREARVLLRNRRYEGAYYLCGYAVELGLKACFAKQTKRYDYPDRKLVLDVYTHKLKDIVEAADLQAALTAHLNADKTFATNWRVAGDWKEDARYQSKTRKEARDLYKAVTSRSHGVMTWIRSHW